MRTHTSCSRRDPSGVSAPDAGRRRVRMPASRLEAVLPSVEFVDCFGCPENGSAERSDRICQATVDVERLSETRC